MVFLFFCWEGANELPPPGPPEAGFNQEVIRGPCDRRKPVVGWMEASSSLVTRSRLRGTPVVGVPLFLLGGSERAASARPAGGGLQSGGHPGSLRPAQAGRGVDGSEFEPRHSLQVKRNTSSWCSSFFVGRERTSCLHPARRVSRLHRADTDKICGGGQEKIVEINEPGCYNQKRTAGRQAGRDVSGPRRPFSQGRSATPFP